MGSALPEVYPATPRGQAAATGGSADFNHHSWGWGGDFVWGVLLMGLLWACFSLWWR